jgi:hypothetical protein
LDPNGGCDEHALLDAVKQGQVLLEGVLAGEWRDATEALPSQALAGDAQNRIVGHEIWAVCLDAAGATLEAEVDLYSRSVDPKRQMTCGSETPLYPPRAGNGKR